MYRQINGEKMAKYTDTSPKIFNGISYRSKEELDERVRTDLETLAFSVRHVYIKIR